MSLHGDESTRDCTSPSGEASGVAARSKVATRQLLVAPAIALGLCVTWILVLAIPGGLLLFVLFTAPVLFVLPPRLMVLPWLAIGLAMALVVDVVSRHSQMRCSRWSACGSALVSTVMLALLVSYPSVPDSVASTASRRSYTGLRTTSPAKWRYPLANNPRAGALRPHIASWMATPGAQRGCTATTSGGTPNNADCLKDSVCRIDGSCLGPSWCRQLSGGPCELSGVCAFFVYVVCAETGGSYG